MTGFHEGYEQPTRLGRYEKIARIASGGMAEIFLARIQGPAGFRRIVVIKQVLPHLARRPRFKTMFLDEARIVASLRHANIVQVHELGLEGEDLYMVMEYLDGEPLSRLVSTLSRAGLRLELGLAVSIAVQALRGLQAAHEHVDESGTPLAVVHRDVSPQNLFITYEGVVKLLDFGIAKAANRTSVTETGELKGKHAYMSPEQCVAGKVDRRTDIFAMGIVLWEMCTGERLFTRENALLVLRAIVEEPIPPPSEVVADFPLELERIILKALSRHPADRYWSAEEMRTDLFEFLRHYAQGRALDDELEALMHQRFATRIAEKRELLRRLHDSTQVLDVTWAEEVTSEPERPATGSLGTNIRSLTNLRLDEPSAPHRTQRREGRYPLIGAMVVSLGAVLIALAWRSSFLTPLEGLFAPEHARDSSAGAVSPEIGDSEPFAPSEPADEIVELRVEVTPPGALVFWDGQLRGIAPLSLTLPRDSDGHELRVSAAGYETAVIGARADADAQVWRLALNENAGLSTASAPNGQPRPPNEVPSTEPRPAASRQTPTRPRAIPTPSRAAPTTSAESTSDGETVTSARQTPTTSSRPNPEPPPTAPSPVEPPASPPRGGEFFRFD